MTTLTTVVVRPTRGFRALKLNELWDHRELLFFLVWRDVKVRYKQTALGAAWAVLQPFLTMLVFAVFFGHLARIPSDGAPYPLFTYAALVPWQFFAFALTQSANSLVANRDLLTKVYFPRLAVPVATMFVGLVDLAVASVLLVGMMLYYGVTPTAALAAAPLFIVLAGGAALGAGLWLCALNVQYRDVRHAVPFVVQLWFFTSPVVYPTSMLPERWRVAFGLNPMASVIEGIRWSLLGVSSAPPAMFVVSFVVASVLLVTGAIYFRRVERTFADFI
jgi:homopolymeric O-antigen transport system permease protein